ncbi:NUDIX hydrolase [soil metagenome]
MAIAAAGGLLWRHIGADLRLGVVHRPRYRDWSLPKGTLDPGEIPLLAAAREVAEETGLTTVVGRRLPSTRYRSLRGPKVVDYWAMRATGEFTANREVDRMEWLSPAEAVRRLSYRHDEAVVEDLLSAPLAPVGVLLVRHAKAGRREAWSGPDEDRPLDEAGRRQAEALAGALLVFTPTRVLSADRVRCTQTVTPLAAALGVPVEPVECFSEEGYDAAPTTGRARLAELLAGPGTTVICSQGGAIPDLIAAAAGDRTRITGARAGSIPARKGSVWALSSHQGRLVSADYYRRMSAET